LEINAMLASAQPLSPVSILRAYDHVSLLDLGAAPALNDFGVAQTIGKEVLDMRRARGERPVGYKIGFTNRGIWPLYGVSQPIWAPVFDTTVTHLPGQHAQIGLSRFVAPRLEPEIVIGLHSTPKDDSIEAIQESIDWVAHGFELVQSHFPDWKFTAAQAQACQGLHGALLVGPKTYIKPGSVGLAQTLSAARVALCLANTAPAVQDAAGAPASFAGEQLIEEGVGANVLDGPIQALSFLVRGLANEGRALQPGDLVTTGTLTDAKAMKFGQSWRTYWLAEPLALEAGGHRRALASRLALARHKASFLSELVLDVV
jgi:2-keto-4-pentenoate hydratase